MSGVLNGIDHQVKNYCTLRQLPNAVPNSMLRQPPSPAAAVTLLYAIMRPAAGPGRLSVYPCVPVWVCAATE
jgi:hypothetical protein